MCKFNIKIILGALICISLFSNLAYAEPRYVDLESMTVAELEKLENEIKAEKKSAVYFDSEIYQFLKADFSSLLNKVAPENKRINLPFFGLEKCRERECYQLWGTCVAEFTDESEQKFANAHAIYWHDVEQNVYKHVAFYTDDNIYFLDVELLQKVACYLDQATLNRLSTNDQLIQVEALEENAPKSIDATGKIKMIYGSQEYCELSWPLDAVVNHLKELGFVNFKLVACSPDDDSFNKNIYGLSIQKGIFQTEEWIATEEFNSNDEITIYYNDAPTLSVEDCSDFEAVLKKENINYKRFAREYDGRYVKFDGYVTRHTTYDGGTSHIIDVTIGDYDGVSELGHDEIAYSTLIVRIGDRIWGNSINKAVREGEHVTITGRIDASWTEYYKQFYVETLSLERR